MLGTRALQIFDETTCVVRATLRWTEFYKHESCGKCTPCREGTWWLVQTLTALEKGQGTRGRPRPAARPVRQHPRPLVLRARRRSHQPGHLARSSSSATSTCAPGPRRLPVRPGRLDGLARRGGRPLTTAPKPRRRRLPRLHDEVIVHHRRHPVERPQGHPGDPRRRAGRHPDPALLRPPAARAGRSLPPVPGRRPRRRQRPRLPQAAGLLHAAGRRGHGRQHPGHRRGRRQGAAGRHGVPAHQPPARLPGLRQGRRVPAPEPGDDATAAASPASEDGGIKRTYPKPINISAAGAAGPRALRAVRALHALLRGDRGRPVHRADRARRPPAGRHRREGAVRVATSPATRSRSARSAR